MRFSRGKYDPEVCEGFLKLRGESVTRGHNLKLFKTRSRLNLRARSFPHRSLDAWNCLPQQVVDAQNVLTFERRLDKFLDSQALKYDYQAQFKIPDTGNIMYDQDDLMSEAS